ncbi:MAG: DUF3703 domain-containing protein [Chitinophagales bacterium]|nr:DUF3703 domain-containing protein [Chitinophagales bacterium]
MKFYTCIPHGLKLHFHKELATYKDKMVQAAWHQAWQHLENAHVLGQNYPIEHTLVHWEMLKFGFRIKNFHEVIGQIPRLLFGGIKSFIGRVPVGNTGGANVPILKPMPIRGELQNILKQYHT